MNIFDPAFAAVSVPQPIPVIGESLAFVADRVGKITRACVMIENALPDQHQLLSQNVDYALQLMRDIHDCEYAPELATYRDIARIPISIRQLANHFDLCHTAGLVSDMNYQLIAGELKNVEQFVREKLMTYCIGQVSFPFRIPEQNLPESKTPFMSLESLFATTEKKSGTQTIEKPQEQKIIPESKTGTVPAQPQIKDIKPERTVQIPQKISTEKTFSKNSQYIAPVSGEDKKERRDAIMRTIRSEGQVTIKDIAKNIRGCSEKTIQRDLQELIQHGVLIREGEKRWAVYKLAMKNV